MGFDTFLHTTPAAPLFGLGNVTYQPAWRRMHYGPATKTDETGMVTQLGMKRRADMPFVGCPSPFFGLYFGPFKAVENLLLLLYSRVISPRVVS